MEENELINRVHKTNKFPFSFQEIKLILISDFDITYLKRNKYLFKCFYVEAIFEDLLTYMTLFVREMLQGKQKISSLYECVDTMKTKYVRLYPEIKQLRNDSFYFNFLPLIRDIKIFD
jgi:hypothetical protein